MCDKIVFNIFGSKSSLDCDVFVPLPTELHDVCRKMKPHELINIAKKYEAELLDQIKTTKKLNVNIGIVEDGIITWVHKGSLDETNNSIFYTYGNHIELQQFPCIITRCVARDIDIKIIRSLRIVLSMLSRTNLRVEVKAALNANTVKERIESLKKISFQDLVFNLTTTNSHYEIRNIYKTISFQMAITCALLLAETIELYSKEDVINKYPELYKYIMREELVLDDLEKLTQFKNQYISFIESYANKNPQVYTRKEILVNIS